MGDLRAIARSGIIIDDMVDPVALLSLTAPGRDVLPWDLSVCGHADDSECSGPAGCRVDALAAARWHRNVARRWSWFMTYLRRALQINAQYFKVYEWQLRGVLHIHALMRFPPGVSARRIRAAIRLLAPRFGFGRVMAKGLLWLPAADVPSELIEGAADSVEAVAGVAPAATVSAARSPRAAAAGYVAKYCGKGYDELGEVRMLDDVTGELSCSRLRPWSTSAAWGDTMRTCKQRRLSWHQAHAGPPLAQRGVPAAPGGGAALDPYWNLSTVFAGGSSLLGPSDRAMSPM